MLDTIHDTLRDWAAPLVHAFQQAIDLGTAHPIMSFMIITAMSVYLMNRQSSAI